MGKEEACVLIMVLHDIGAISPTLLDRGEDVELTAMWADVSPLCSGWLHQWR